MKWNNVFIRSLAYRLAPEVVTSADLESRLAPITERLGWQPGYLEKMTGIRERRWWEPRYDYVQAGADAAAEACQKANISGDKIGAVVYGGVCRPYREPATACAVAEHVGTTENAIVHDVSNACLGFMDAMISIANRIELGQIQYGIAVSCESAREINETIIRQLHENAQDLPRFLRSLATFTGGSAAVAAVLCHRDVATDDSHQLIGGVVRGDARFNKLCRWGYEPTDDNGHYEAYMHTDASGVLNHGVALGVRTWDAFLAHHQCTTNDIQRTICHQVGSAHRDAVLGKLGMSADNDFVTYPTLGNTGSCALPLTAAIGAEQGFVQAGQRIAFLGIGSGLNCTMLAVDW